ncbi:MAG: PH domain-containing protein [Planctomycetota bacterium]|jgi:putative membrane protein
MPDLKEPGNATKDAGFDFDPNRLQIPAPQLFSYYLLGALLSGPLIVIILPALWFRYSTLKYQFEETGLRMQVGFLFKKEVVTSYRRIQDIHLTSGVIQRWLGIASISIQTASGSAMPEIVIEGVTEPEKLRDWLYERLRGTKYGNATGHQAISSAALHASSQQHSDEVRALLSEIRDNLAIVANHRRGGDA